MFDHTDFSMRRLRRAISQLTLTAAALTTVACDRSLASVPRPRSSEIDTASATPQADDTLGFPAIPNPGLTPGDVFPVTAADICVPGYTKKVRDVPAEVKRQAYARYGVRTHEPGEYEVDHLISLSLGGSNSIRNLWPESFRTSPWNAYVKDDLENELHRRVCAGTMNLAEAQRAIANNWVVGYRHYVHSTPLPAGPRKNRQPRARNAPSSQPAVP